MEMLTRSEAARMLELSVRQFQRVVKAGHLIKHGKQYDANEVAELKEIRSKNWTLTEVVIRAQQAHMTAFRAERELRLIKDIVGFNLPYLGLDPDAVKALHTTVENLSLIQHLFSAKEIISWSRIFLAIGEEYFEAVTLHMKIREPWWMYIELGEVMAKTTTPERMRMDLELKMAYDYLTAARPQLRTVAFSRDAQTYGKRHALKMFPEMKGKDHQHVLDIMTALDTAKRNRKRR